MVAAQFPSVVLRFPVCTSRTSPHPGTAGLLLPRSRGPGRWQGGPAGGPNPATRIVGTVRGLEGNRARRYRRINNTGSRSYVKRPPCYARRYCHRRWVRSSGGAGKRWRKGQDATGTFYLQRRAPTWSRCGSRLVYLDPSSASAHPSTFFSKFRFDGKIFNF